MKTPILPGQELRQAILTIVEAWDRSEIIAVAGSSEAFVVKFEVTKKEREAIRILRRAVAGTVPETRP